MNGVFQKPSVLNKEGVTKSHFDAKFFSFFFGDGFPDEFTEGVTKFISNGEGEDANDKHDDGALAESTEEKDRERHVCDYTLLC